MLDVLGKLGEQFKEFLSGWPTFIAVGTFLLYLTGYLSTRYYLTVLGVGADLSVIDEHYFFAGAKFVVYLVSLIPILLMPLIALAIVLGLLKGLVWLARLFKSNRASDIEPQPSNGLLTAVRDRLASSTSTVPAITGIVLALFLIQLIMRKCFLLSNVLVAESLPDIGFGLEQLLLDEDGLKTTGYFLGLLAGTISTTAIWLLARRLPQNNWRARSAVFILGCLVLIEFLFLPINYGIFVQGKFLPRVADLGGQAPLPQGHNAWLVWEGTHTFTYLVEEPSPQPAASPTPNPIVQTSANGVAVAPSPTPCQPPFGRKLISIPQKDLKQITIIKYDPIIRHVFCRGG